MIESYAHIINTDKSILKLNPAIEKFGYQFVCINATELEKNYSEIVNIPKSNDRKLTIIIGMNQHAISHELNKALFHDSTFGQRFIHSEYPEITLLKKIDNFKLTGDINDFVNEHNNFLSFYSFVNDLILQLRLFKAGEIRCSQHFQMTSETRQVSFRKTEISIGSRGNYSLNNEEAKELSGILKANYISNALTELAINNFSIVFNIPDVRIRFITLMTCLESLFNLGKDQIAHSIARHLSIIISENKEQFQENYLRIKKLYNIRNSIVHGGEHKSDLVQDYLDLADKVRRAINFCNTSELSKEKLFEDLNSRGY